MLFSSTVFLFIFLPTILFFYYIAHPKLKNSILLLASLIFYAWGEPKFVIIMIISIIMNYIFALIVDTNRDKKTKVKFILGIMVASNLSLLAVFKYANFAISNLNKFFATEMPLTNIILPIGISFYTFQAISYVIDVYRGDGKVQKNPLNVALYISLFPQLMAGPIVRYNTIAQQITLRKETLSNFSIGIRRFIIGLSKKMLLANNCGLVADQIFSQDPSQLSTGVAWIGIVAYTLQIYFDFSGYSDMAIGLGKMFGFDFLENFNYPYISKSISEFWRRWHISLGSWFRDYVYIPLGGNRKGNLTTYRNLFIVWCLTGFWHGAGWSFLVWGGYYAVLIMCERAFLDKWVLSKVPSLFNYIYTLLVVMIGWVFFRSESLTLAYLYLKALFGLNGDTVSGPVAEYYLSQNWIILVVAVIAATPIAKKLMISIIDRANTFLKTLMNAIIQPVFYMALMLLTVYNLISTTFNPFIYFRF